MSIVVRIAALGLGFLQAVLTARLLGPEGYGTVAVALSITAIIATCAMLGFGPFAVREVARLSVRADWSDLRGFLRFSGLAVFGASIIAGAAIAALALGTELFDAHFRREIAIASILVLPLAMLMYFRGVLQGFGQLLAAQLPGDLLRPIIRIAGLGILFVAASRAMTISYLVVAIVASSSAAIVAAVAFWRINTHRIPAASAASHPRQWSRSAAPFFVIFMLGVVGTEANTLLLGWLAGPTEAGLFQPVARLAPIMLIANEALAMPLAPRIAARWAQRDVEGIRHLYRLATRVGTLGTVLIALVLVLLAPVSLFEGPPTLPWPAPSGPRPFR